MNTKNLSIAALICGIVGIGGSFIPYAKYIMPLCAIASIVLGGIALSQIKKTGETENKSLALGGLICGIVSLAWGVVSIACTVCALLACAGMASGLAVYGVIL